MADDAMNGRRAGGAQVFRPARNLWTVEFDGHACRLEPTNGVRVLATLLAHPDEEIPALVLEQSFLHPGSGPTPCDRRPLHDARERACTAVSEAMEETVAAIARQQPALARHLRASLRIGMRCAYAPAA